MKTDKEPVSETTCSLEYKSVDKGQEPSNPDKLTEERVGPANTDCGNSDVRIDLKAKLMVLYSIP
jgi:hypothetical protein